MFELLLILVAVGCFLVVGLVRQGRMPISRRQFWRHSSRRATAFSFRGPCYGASEMSDEGCNPRDGGVFFAVIPAAYIGMSRYGSTNDEYWLAGGIPVGIVPLVAPWFVVF